MIYVSQSGTQFAYDYDNEKYVFITQSDPWWETLAPYPYRQELLRIGAMLCSDRYILLRQHGLIKSGEIALK